MPPLPAPPARSCHSSRGPAGSAAPARPCAARFRPCSRHCSPRRSPGPPTTRRSRGHPRRPALGPQPPTLQSASTTPRPSLSSPHTAIPHVAFSPAGGSTPITTRRSVSRGGIGAAGAVRSLARVHSAPSASPSTTPRAPAARAATRRRSAASRRRTPRQMRIVERPPARHRRVRIDRQPVNQPDRPRRRRHHRAGPVAQPQPHLQIVPAVVGYCHLAISSAQAK